MSQESLEIVRRSIDAFRRADWEVMAATLDPHILVRTDANWPEPRFYGRKATIDFYEGLWESGGHDLRIEEIMDLGDRVLLRACWHVHGQQSGVEGEQRYSTIITFRDGRAILAEFFLEHEQALEAVGLSR